MTERNPEDLLTARQATSARRRTLVFDPRTAERREGYYIGTDYPHTDENGLAIDRHGTIMWPYPITATDKWFAYFIQHEEGGPIKIGMSSDPEERLRGININSHDPRYKLLGVMPGGRTQEKNLHIQFRHIRVHGEWFLPEPELLDYIANLEVSDDG
jgi:Meiotically up-regulated gene 113